MMTRRVVRRDRGDDTDRLVTADAQRHPSARRARRPGPGSPPRAPSTGRGRSSIAGEHDALPSCTASANIVGWPASATIVATSVVAHSPRRGRRSARTTGGPARRPPSTAHGPSSNARRPSAIARPNSAAAWPPARRPASRRRGSRPRSPRPRRPTGRRRTSDARRSWRPTWLPPSAPAGPEQRRTTFYLSRNVLARNPRRRGHGITPASRSSPMRSHEYPSSRSTISECSPCSGARRRAGARSSNCTGTAGSR